MAKSKLIRLNKTISEKVANTYKKIQDTFVDGYIKIEDTFVDLYLTKDGETIEEAKERLKNEKIKKDNYLHT